MLYFERDDLEITNLVALAWLYYFSKRKYCRISFVLIHSFGGKNRETVLITADAMVTRYFLPDSTLAIMSYQATHNIAYIII